jgi:L-aminopeptidase/D-esterase-like protein
MLVLWAFFWPWQSTPVADNISCPFSPEHFLRRTSMAQSSIGTSGQGIPDPASRALRPDGECCKLVERGRHARRRRACLISSRPPRQKLALVTITLSVLLGVLDAAASPPRARDLGVPFQGIPGRYNAITDVTGVEVGQTTLIRGSGSLVRGQGPVRTGVTIIHPLGKDAHNGVAAGRAVINGTGEWTGMAMVDEIGQLYGPIALTGTGNLSVVHQALIDWALRRGSFSSDELMMRLIPAVGETLDLPLNDVFGHPMTAADVFAALDGASPGPVTEGNVGGGTGMVAYRFKGGIGTASRVLSVNGTRYVVGVLLQANNGQRKDLRIAGIPIGEEIPDLLPEEPPCATASCQAQQSTPFEKRSLLMVIATDIPLDARQLARVARRA